LQREIASVEASADQKLTVVEDRRLDAPSLTGSTPRRHSQSRVITVASVDTRMPGLGFRYGIDYSTQFASDPAHNSHTVTKESARWLLQVAHR
jgi:hypothetical protein